MELKEYLTPLRKWWWLLLLTTLVSTTAAYIGTLFQEPVYRTSTTLMIGQAIADPNPSGTDFYLGSQLAQTYADIARRKPVRQATMDALGLTWLPQYTVSARTNNQLLEIAVVDTSPVRAQAVANMLAFQLVQQSPTSDQQEDQQRQGFIRQQLDSLEANIKETEGTIAELQTAVAEMVSARQIADTQSQIAALQGKLTTLQTNYANLLSNTRQGALNTLTVIEEAELPEIPVGPNVLLTVLLGAAIGLVLSAGAAYLMEYLDDTLKTPEEIFNALQAPLIGFLVEDDSAAEEEEQLVVAAQPRAPVTEAYRTLRTNLEFAAVDSPLQTILITSPNSGDGKSTVAANLAAMMAQAGRRVLLIDADLRRPRVHRFLNLGNQIGLSDVFRGQMELLEATQPVEGIDNLAAVTSGRLPPDPTELLGSAKMEQILAEAREQFDVIIVDSPPFIVADPSVLAARVDGVLLVLQPGRTSANLVRPVREQLQRADARVVGVVLNRIPRSGGYYYGGYRYYYAPYYYNRYYGYGSDQGRRNGHNGKNRNGNGWLGRLVGNDRAHKSPEGGREIDF